MLKLKQQTYYHLSSHMLQDVISENFKKNIPLHYFDNAYDQHLEAFEVKKNALNGDRLGEIELLIEDHREVDEYLLEDLLAYLADKNLLPEGLYLYGAFDEE